MNDTNLIEFAASGAPPLVPFVPNNEQQRFMDLHRYHLVVKYHWRMQETQLRAFTDTGLVATIHRDALAELIEQGLMQCDAGCTYRLTNKDQ